MDHAVEVSTERVRRFPTDRWPAPVAYPAFTPAHRWGGSPVDDARILVGCDA
jgi:hypothetical protein